MHSYKLAATLQHNTIQGSGIQLLKIINGAGHETGKGTDIESVQIYLSFRTFY